MRKFRFIRNLVILFIRRFGLVILLGILAGGALFIFYGKLSPSVPGTARVERVGIVGRFNQENLPVPILSMISLGLTTLGNENVPVASIAESWEPQEAGKVWIFKIKQGLRWQDNSPLQATDFSYKFPGVEVTYPDSLTIRFQLPDPYSPFPVVVSRPFFKKGLLGVGAWRVKNITTLGGVIKELVLEGGKPQVHIFYRFYPTEQAMISAFKLGEIDKILEITDPKKIFSWPKVEIEKVVHKDRFVGIFLNTQDPTFSEKSTRQALAYAIKKEGKSIRAFNSISPVSWAYNPLVKTYEYNPARAQELLGKLSKEQKGNLKVRLVTIPSLLTLAEQIAKNWEEVGIKTEVQVGSGVPENFQALLATQLIPPDPDQYSMWHSTQTQTNITQYKNPRIDKLLEDGRKALNQEERRKIYLDFQRFLVEDSPVIFLYYPESYTVSRK